MQPASLINTKKRKLNETSIPNNDPNCAGSDGAASELPKTKKRLKADGSEATTEISSQCSVKSTKSS